MGRFLLPVFFSLAFYLAQGQTIGTFTSIVAQPQDQFLHIPSSHVFQVLLQAGAPLSDGKPIWPRFDFTGYVPIAGSSENGYLGINHESTPGGMSVLDIQFDTLQKKWGITHGKAVDFTPLGNLLTPGTRGNCSGAVTPWGTLITCEELYSGTDYTGDGYFDLGWCIEVNPVTRTIRDVDGDRNPEKLWSLGRMKHENVVIAPDSQTVYFGDDNIVTGNLYKFIADRKTELDSGRLYVLDLGRDTGIWKLIPNSTPAECNSVMGSAYFAGATIFQRIEDVDIGPDGMVYFASTNNGKIYRFKDLGSTISNFEVFVDNRQYVVNTIFGPDTVLFSWPDNLAFDGEGNLWITQDGGDSHVWVVRPSHTAISPAVEIFMNTPAGCEPTGITFSPDYRFMFMSLQHPWGGNTFRQPDVFGDTIVWNRDAALVIALRGDLGITSTIGGIPGGVRLLAQYPNPASDFWMLDIESSDTAEAALTLTDPLGRSICNLDFNLLPGINTLRIDLTSIASGVYFATLTSGTSSATFTLIH